MRALAARRPGVLYPVNVAICGSLAWVSAVTTGD